MKIFRNRKDKQLYTIEYVSPMKVSGSWYEATGLHGGKTKRYVRLAEYDVVSER